MKRFFIRIGLMVVLLVFIQGTTTTAIAQIFEYKGVPTYKEGFAPGEVLVKFKQGASETAIQELNSRFRVNVRRVIPRIAARRLTLPQGAAVMDMVNKFRSSPLVEYAEPNYYAHAFMIPNDTLYSYQWHLDNAIYGGIQMENAWDISTGSSNVTVAIVDGGIAYEDYQESHSRKYEQAPDLAETSFWINLGEIPGNGSDDDGNGFVDDVNGWDFVNNDAHPNDDTSPGHGTHVAGTVAQSTNNNLGVSGIAFNTCLLPVKVLDNKGVGTYDDVAAGIIYAVDNGANVINLSLGGSSPSTTLENALAYAYGEGVTIIAAAGNDGEETVNYPAAYDAYVIAVGATQYDEDLAPYSNYGPSLDIVAPGGNINLDQNQDGYGDGVLQQTYEKKGQSVSWAYYFIQGTSMAAPHVSGVAALLIANGNATTPDDIRAALQETAEDKGTAGRDDTYGWGIVDAYAALQWTVQVTDNSYNELWPIISFSDNGQGLMVWSIHHNWWQKNQYMYYSLWDGSSWSSGIPFDTTGWRHNRMSIDYKPGTNEAMLVFGGSRYFLTFDDICYVEWDGESWESEYYLADNVDDDDYQGTFKWSPDGNYALNIWVDDNVWNDDYDKRAIAYSIWDASSSSWVDSATITTFTPIEPENFTRHGDGGLDFDPSSEKAIVTYYRDDGDGSEIYYQVWDGSSWGGELRLTYNIFDDTLPWVKFDDDGNGIIIWQRFDGYDWEIYYSLCVWDEDAFTFTEESAMTSTSNTYDDNNPTAVYDSLGILHVFWYQKVLGTDTEILYSTFDGTSFSGPIQITDNAMRDVNQLPGIDNNGNIHLVWLQHDGNDYEVMRTIITPPLAEVSIVPETFDLRSSGRWMTSYIELPAGYNAADIDVSTVKISKVGETVVNIPAELKPTKTGDYDKDGIPDLKVRFNRSGVGDLLEPLELDEVELTITGELTYGTPFDGSCTIRVIDKGKGLMKKAAVINTPDDYGLFQNYPNPFNPETEIRYQLPNPSEVSLNIYNLMGQEIKILINSYHSAGYYSVKWDGTNNQGMKVASGIYIYIMRAGSFVDVKKLIFIQ